MKERTQKIIYYAVVAACMVMVMLITSCKSVRYVPVGNTIHDSIFIKQIQYDSIMHRDSIYVLVKGDTVREYRDRYLYRDRVVHDTTFINRTDTIRVPIPVEAKVTSWDIIRFLYHHAYCLVAIIVLYFLLRWLAKRTRRF